MDDHPARSIRGDLRIALRADGSVQEIAIAEFILEAVHRATGMVTTMPPIVAVNANSSNPHYSPTT